VHPRSVAAINDGFRLRLPRLTAPGGSSLPLPRPSDDALRLDGKLVDGPVIHRARAIPRIMDSRAG